MKTLSLTAAFAFLFFSAANAGIVKKQAPKSTKANTVQKAPVAVASKAPATTEKAPGTKKSVVKSKPTAAKSSAMKPAPEKKGVPAVAKPAPKHASNFTRSYSRNKIEMTGHKKHHKAGHKAAAKPSK